MQRLVKPSDYILQDVLGKSMYLIPWEDRICPGNPADDPEVGATLYNEFAQAEANGVQQLPAAEQVAEIIKWAIATPGEAARGLAVDLAAAYQGRYQFLIEDLEHWDDETKAYRAFLVFHCAELRELPAQAIMALRVRAVSGVS